MTRPDIQPPALSRACHLRLTSPAHRRQPGPTLTADRGRLPGSGVLSLLLRSSCNRKSMWTVPRGSLVGPHWAAATSKAFSCGACCHMWPCSPGCP